MVGEALRGLESRFPWLARWSGGRLDIELPALTLSLLVHGLILAGLAFAGYQVHRESLREFRSEVVGYPAVVGLDVPGPGPVGRAAGGDAGGRLVRPEPGDVDHLGAELGRRRAGHGVARGREPALAPELARLDVRRATEVVVPTASLLGQTVSIRGNGAETVGGVEGAVDRIANEIIRHLEQGPTLVVWAFDASGSLVAERQRLSKHIETVYSHIKQLDESHLSADSGLLTMVVAFGQDRKAMLPKPTGELSEVLAAIAEVPQDETGKESTFTTVGEIVNKWGRYKGAHNHPYRTMVIVVTDEVGDDEAPARGRDRGLPSGPRCRSTCSARRPSSAASTNYVDLRQPQDQARLLRPRGAPGAREHHAGADPAAVLVRRAAVHVLESGFGPYALSRLAAATGGIYFITRFDTRRMGFDPARMREYRPDWVHARSMRSRSRTRPLRQAVLNAALITQQRLPGMPGLYFPPADAPEFKDAMANNQAIAERTAYTVNEALGPINAVAKLRDREPSRRWQAHYDLIRGRLLAMKVRCYEYNWACARMKKDPPKFSNPRSNAWRLVPDTDIQYSKNAAAAAKEAETLLRRVVEEHPATPWALLAQRELKDPLGFKWVENYVPPIRRNNNAAEAKKKKNDPKPAKPQQLPKL